MHPHHEKKYTKESEYMGHFDQHSLCTLGLAWNIQ